MHKDNLKEALHWCEIELKEIVPIAQDRIKWQCITSKAINNLIAERVRQAEAARERHCRAAIFPVPTPTAEFQCPVRHPADPYLACRVTPRFLSTLDSCQPRHPRDRGTIRKRRRWSIYCYIYIFGYGIFRVLIG